MDQLLDSGVDAVVITAPSPLHSHLMSQAANAGKAIFCEKPAGLAIDELDTALDAVAEAGVVLQVGFNRRFAPGFATAKEAILAGRLGSVQLMRSNTRDPLLADPAAVPAGTIFTQTLIHDFDTLNWFNEGAVPVQVMAHADALVRPEFAEHGLLDTALVTIRYSNGALAMADASFQAVYGYDVRAEVFGSGGMVTAGHLCADDAAFYGATGASSATPRSDTDLLQRSYREELGAFVEAVRGGPARGATGADARMALQIALAAIESHATNQPVLIQE